MRDCDGSCSVSAGTINFLCGLVQGHHGSDSGSGVGDDWVRAAFCWGLSCGAASCGSESNSIFDASVAASLFAATQPRPLTPAREA